MLVEIIVWHGTAADSGGLHTAAAAESRQHGAAATDTVPTTPTAVPCMQRGMQFGSVSLFA